MPSAQRRLLNVVKLISEGVWAGTVQSYLRGSEHEPARGAAMLSGPQQFVAARLTPGRGDFPF